MSAGMSLLRSNRFIRTVVVGSLFTQLGVWVRNLAILLYVMDRTSGDPVSVSLISVAEYAPIFLFSFIGGAFADRWRPRRTAIRCDLLSALSVFLVWPLLAAGAWEAVFAVTLGSAILSQFAQPAGMKLFRLHVPEAEAQPAMALLQTVSSLFLVLGPAIGTFAYQTLGLQPAVLLTGAAFLLSAWMMAGLPADGEPGGDSARVRASALREMQGGIRYVLSRKTLLSLSLCFAIVGFGAGVIAPLGIFLVTERLGLTAEHLYWITVPYGIGEIAGGVAAFRLAGKLSPLKLLALGLAANAAGIALMGLSGELWLAMAAQFLVALFQPAIFVGNNVLAMQHTDPAYIGRVTGIRTPLMTGAMLLGMSASGLLKQSFSLIGVYELAAFFFAAGCLTLLPLRKPHPSPPSSPQEESARPLG